MVTKEQAEKMTYEEAALCQDMNVEDRKTAEILTEKALFYLAEKEEIDISVDDDGEFLYSIKKGKEE